MERDRIRISPWALRVTGGMDLTAVRLGMSKLLRKSAIWHVRTLELGTRAFWTVDLKCDALAHMVHWDLEGVLMRSRQRIRGFRG